MCPPTRFFDFDVEKLQRFGIGFFGSDFLQAVQVFKQILQVLFDVPASGRKLKVGLFFGSFFVSIQFP